MQLGISRSGLLCSSSFSSCLVEFFGAVCYRLTRGRRYFDTKKETKPNRVMCCALVSHRRQHRDSIKIEIMMKTSMLQV